MLCHLHLRESNRAICLLLTKRMKKKKNLNLQFNSKFCKLNVHPACGFLIFFFTEPIFSFVNDLMRMHHLLVHLNVQAVGHLVILKWIQGEKAVPEFFSTVFVDAKPCCKFAHFSSRQIGKGLHLFDQIWI